MPDKKRIFISHSKIDLPETLENSINEKNVELFFFPTIEIKPLSPNENEFHKLKNYSSYDYLIFTSANAVKYFIQIIGENNFQANRNLQIVATGEKTANELNKLNIEVNILPNKFSASGVLDVLPENLSGKKILIPGSKISRKELRLNLAARGATVDFIPIYDTVTRTAPEIETNNLKEVNFDAFVFTSPSSFFGFLKIFDVSEPQIFFKNRTVIPIGDVTAKSIESESVESGGIPEKFTVEKAIEKAISIV